MDAKRFDAMAKAMTAGTSRRRTFGGMASLLGLLYRDVAGAESGKCKGTCGSCGRCTKGRCKKTPHGKRCKLGKCTPTLDGIPCPGGFCQGGSCIPPPPHPCTDGIKNGSETDIDCGGSCARCANGLACASRNDCASALCVDRTCEQCSTGDQCLPDDPHGPCVCATTVNGQHVCSKFEDFPVDNCGRCSPIRNCVDWDGKRFCWKPCRTA